MCNGPDRPRSPAVTGIDDDAHCERTTGRSGNERIDTCLRYLRVRRMALALDGVPAPSAFFGVEIGADVSAAEIVPGRGPFGQQLHMRKPVLVERVL